ncbi:AbiTii domain-containing protein, partial [Acinetobacter wuhouensis]
MSLLREIQNDAVNSNVKVSDLLRRCKVLAYRLGNEDFKTWVDSELNGYELLDGIPSYRIFNN